MGQGAQPTTCTGAVAEKIVWDETGPVSFDVATFWPPT